MKDLVSNPDSHPGVKLESGNIGDSKYQHPTRIATFSNRAHGDWGIEVALKNTTTAPNRPVKGFLVVSSKSPYRLATHLASYNLLKNEKLGLVAYIYDVNDGDEKKVLTNTIKKSYVLLEHPSGEIKKITMLDDGEHNDKSKDDGIVGAVFEAEEIGTYTAQVVVEASTRQGESFVRTTQHFFPVIGRSVKLADTAVVSETDDKDRLRIDLAAQIEDFSKSYRVSAELWGASPSGGMIPVTWLSNIITPNASTALSLSLDIRWILNSMATAPFELRDIQVSDEVTHIPLSLKDNAKLTLPSVYVNNSTNNNLFLGKSDLVSQKLEITDDMLMGKKPAITNYAPSILATGTESLMLVHGYCSGPMWPTQDFTNYIVFSDPKRNRSNAEFAKEIQLQGQGLNSYGIIAHSQGGNAALHLYANYWSGLDNSVGLRKIQSVGSPYQGTNVATNLAAIGAVFGAGCGQNWDLSPDGAKLWLAGIPGWARDKVYFRSTSFTDRAFRYDYCNLVTDVFLSDPDDGLVSKAATELPGGRRIDHATGWCHTTGMRDPAQYYDHARNSAMNSSAAR